MHNFITVGICLNLSAVYKAVD